MISIAELSPTSIGGASSIVTYTPGDDSTGVTTSRASPATYLDVNGTLQTVPNGVIRDGHYVRGARTYLHEAFTTNLCTSPNGMATWATGSHANNITQLGTTDGPDAFLTAQGNQSDPSTSTTGTRILQGGVVSAFTNAFITVTPAGQVDGPVTSSVWLRGNYNVNKLYIWHLAGGTYTRTLVQLQTKWTRYSVTSIRSGTNFLFGIGIDGADAGQSSLFGGPSQEWHVAYYQMENLPEATSYTATTRAADTFSFPFSTTPVAMTVYARYYDQGLVVDADATGKTLFTIGGTGANRFTTNLTSTGPAFSLNYRTGSTDHVATDATSSLISLGDLVEVRATLSGAGASGISHSLNGAAETTPGTSSASLPGAWTTGTFELGTYGGAQVASIALQFLRVLSGVQTLATCRTAGDAPITPATNNTPATIKVTPKFQSMVLGAGSVQLSAVVRNASGTVITDSVTWTSDNPPVATVTGAGVVNSITAGTAIIQATSSNPTVNDTSQIIVTQDTVTSTVTVAPATASLNVNSTVQLTATSKNSAGQSLGGKTPSWTTSNATVATVSTAGLVMAHAGGTATITATEGGRTGTSTITVTVSLDVTPDTVEMQPLALAGYVLGSGKAAAIVKNVSGVILTVAQAPVTWASTNTAVATVSSTGLVTFVGAGSCNITATTTNGKVGTIGTTIQSQSAPPVYSATSPHWTHVHVQWTDFGFRYRPDPVTNPGDTQALVDADVALKASRCDAIMSGSTRYWSPCASNSAIRWGPYTLWQHAEMQPGGEAQSVAWTGTDRFTPNTTCYSAVHAAANGYDVETLFLHYYDGQSKYRFGASGGNVTAAVTKITAGANAKITTDFGTVPTNGQRVYLSGLSSYGIPSGGYIATVIDVNNFTIPISVAATTSGINIARAVSLATHPSAVTAGDHLAILTVPGHMIADQSRIEVWGLKTAGIADGNYTWTTIDANSGSINAVATASVGSVGGLDDTLGDGTMTYENRIWFHGWGTWRHISNPKAPWSARFHTARLTPSLSDGPNSKFIFIDELDPTGVGLVNYNAANQLLRGGQVCAVNSLEYDARGLDDRGNDNLGYQYIADMSEDFALIRGSNQNKDLQANAAAYANEANAEPMTKAAGGVQCEQTLGCVSDSSVKLWWTTYRALLADGEVVVAVDSIFWEIDNGPFGTGTANNNSSAYSTNKLRYKVGTYITYLMGMPMDQGQQDRFYIDNNNGLWTHSQASYWLPMMEVPLGRPTTDRIASTISSNDGTQTGDALYYRYYDQGLIVARYAQGYTSTGLSGHPYTFTLPTDRAYYRVLDQGQISATPSTTVDLLRADYALFTVNAPVNYDFFVDASAGLDTNNGTSIATPWRTVAKVNAQSSTTIANKRVGFKKGGTWREQLTNPADGIYYGSYGAGADPILNEADVVGSWSLTSGIIYHATLATSPNQVFKDTTRLTKGTSAGSLTDGQWFWVGSVLSIGSASGSPTGIEASVRNYGFDSNGKNNFTLNGLTFTRSNADESGLNLHFQPSGFTVDSCASSDHYGAGVHINGTSPSGTVKGCTITGCGTLGIYQSHDANLLQLIDNNTVTDCGWRTDQATGQVSAMVLRLSGLGVVSNNTVRRCGSGSPVGLFEHGIYIGGALDNAAKVFGNLITDMPKGYGMKTRSGGVWYNNVALNCVGGGFDVAGNTTANINVLAHHNTFANCGTGTIAGGGVAIDRDTGTINFKGYNNTLYHNSSGGTRSEFAVFANLGGTIDWRNNIVIASPGGNYFQIPTQSGVITLDYQDYFGGSDSSGPYVYLGSHNNFAQWRALGFDTHSLNLDPLFTLPASNDFSLQSTSPVKRAGIVIAGVTTTTPPDLGATE